MGRPHAQPAGAGGVHLVLYDGACGFCSRLVRFLLDHDRRATFRFASLQSAVGRTVVERAGGDPRVLTSVHVVPNYNRANATILTKSDAVLFVAGELGWPWAAARILRRLPTAFRNRVYDLVARHRYQLPGSREACWLPDPDVKDRFIA